MNADTKEAVVQQSLQTVAPQSKSTPEPWERTGWWRRRWREFAYQGVSWPYVVGVAITVGAFLGRMDWWVCVGYWTAVFGIRQVAQPIAQGRAMSEIIRAGNGTSEQRRRPPSGILDEGDA